MPIHQMPTISQIQSKLAGLPITLINVTINPATDGRFTAFLIINAGDLSQKSQDELSVVITKTLETDVTLLIEKAHVAFTGDKKPMPTQPKSPQNPTNRQSISGVKKIIIVASGKGGVGKSTTALNVAMALQQEGLTVGLLDADIYGPSLPLMVDSYDKPDVSPQKQLIPIQKYGLELMSMGFLINKDQPVVWRGPMVQNALQQLLFDVDWDAHGPLDVLVIDTPPGTGDVHLTLAQKLTISGAIIVSTPQDMALIDALKAHKMFLKVEIPILGIIENMAYFCCPHCGKNTDIFSQNGAKTAALEANVPFLGAIPLEPAIRKACDAGIPIAHNTTLIAINNLYMTIAREIISKI